jgi:peptidyl-tRNA hydrolase, PTH1 family
MDYSIRKLRKPLVKSGTAIFPSAVAQHKSDQLVIPIGVMNVLGKNVKAALKSQRILPSDGAIVVAHDDLEQKLGKYRIVAQTSFKGHNGLKSIQQELGLKNFVRIGIGIGRPESREPQVVADFVLSRFEQEELEALKTVFDLICENHIELCTYVPVIN